MRKLVALTLAGALTLGATAPVLAHGDDHGQKIAKVEWSKKNRFESKFWDWNPEFWGNEALARMITKGVIMGNTDGTVAAIRPVSRLEAAIMLSRLLNLEAPEIPYGEFKLEAPWGELKIENKRDKYELKLKTREGEFKIEDAGDIPSWGRSAVLIGLQQGFLIFDGAKLSPMSSLNRLEAAIMLVKAAGLDAEAQAKAGLELEFEDADKIASRLRGYIAVAVEQGFVTGYEDGTFRPHKLVTRAEWASLLDRLDRKGPAVSPDGRQVKGHVTAVSLGSNPSITMTTPVFPGGVTYPVDDTAVFYEKGNEVTLADVVAGDNVIINLSTDRKILMVTVHNVAQEVTGVVTRYTAPTSSTAGSLTLTVDGASRTYSVPAGTDFTLDGVTATAADVRVGDKVELLLEGAHLTRVAIKVERVTFSGTLAAVTQGANSTLPSLTVAGEGNTAATYSVLDHATITEKDGDALTMDDLEAGDRVTLTLERNQITRIVRTQAAAARPEVKIGYLVAVTAPTDNEDGYSLAVLVDNTVEVYTVGPDTALLYDGDVIAADDLRIGDQVQFSHESTLLTTLVVTSRAQ